MNAFRGFVFAFLPSLILWALLIAGYWWLTR